MQRREDWIEKVGVKIIQYSWKILVEIIEAIDEIAWKLVIWSESSQGFTIPDEACFLCENGKIAGHMPFSMPSADSLRG